MEVGGLTGLKKPKFLLACLSTLALSMPVTASEEVGGSVLNAAIENLQDGLDIIIPDGLKRKGVRIRLGAGFGVMPNYVGASDYRFRVVPLLDVRIGSRWRFSNRRLSYIAFLSDNWRVGPFLKHKSGRRESRSAALEGLGDINDTVQVGLFARYRTEMMLFRAEYRHALGASQGDSVRVTFGHGIYKNGKFAAAAVASAKWLSGRAMRTNFGVSADQAANSAVSLEAFGPGAGVSEVSLSLYGRYQLDDRTRLLGLASFGRLVGDAADSPLVAGNTGSGNQLKIGIGFTVDF